MAKVGKLASNKKKLVNFLIAMPSLKENLFKRSVIMMLDSEKSTDPLGIILNKPTDLKVTKVLETFDEKKQFESLISDWGSIVFGGPLDSMFMWVLHDKTHFYQKSKLVNGQLVFSHMEEVVGGISKLGLPKIYEIGIGYSGWEEGQLDREILENSWWKINCPFEVVSKKAYQERWRSLLNYMGVEPENLYDSNISHIQ